MTSGPAWNRPWGPAFAVLVALTSFAGSWLGGVWTAGAVFLAVLAALDLAHFGFSWQALRFMQDFPQNHPVKGGRVSFRLVLEYRAPWPGGPFHLTLRFGQAGKLTRQADRPRLLSRRMDRFQEFWLDCPYRGTYELGVETLVLHDLLGLFQWTFRYPPAVFYVDPAVRDLEIPTCLEVGEQVGTGQGTEDPSSFEALVPWQPAEGLARISWKHWASKGVFVKRTFSRLSARETCLLLDNRRIWNGDELPGDQLAAEDASLEIFLGLARAWCRAGADFSASGLSERSPHGTPASLDFEDFFQAWKMVAFEVAAAPAQWLEGRLLGEGDNLVIVSHQVDPGFFLAAEKLIERGGRVVIYLTTIGWSEADRHGIQQLAEALRRRGGEVELDP